MKNRPNISVFFPCYNDARSIKKLVDDAFLILDRVAEKFEVIVINDGSKDGSRELLQTLSRKYPKLKVFHHPKNMGYGKALQTGFKNAKFDLIFYTDGDGQYDVKELPTLLQQMSDDVDFINGTKMLRQDPTYRVFLGNLYSFFARWMFWLPIFDVDCDFRLIRKRIIDRIKLKVVSGAICIELVKKSERVGAKFRQVSVHHYKREWGNSQFFRADRIFFTMIELIFLWFNLMIKNKFLKT